MARDRISIAVQDALLAILCFDDSPGGARAVRAVVPAGLYDTYQRDLAQEAEVYLDRYKKAPGEATFDLVETLAERRPDRAEAYKQVFHSVALTWKSGLDPKYYLDRARTFARRQRTRAGLMKLAQLTGREDDASMEEADRLLAELARQDKTLSNSGTLLNDPEQALRFLDKREGSYLKWGIKELDDYDLGPKRGGLTLVIGAPNAGKTMAACHLGKVNHLLGERVAHVTLEMSEEMVCQRYVQNFYSVTKRPTKDLKAQRFTKDDLGRVISVRPEPMGKRPHLEREDIREYLTERLEHERNKASLWVRQFPTGQLTVRGLGGYLDEMEGTHGFHPDLLLVDYADIMDLPVKNRREALGKLFIDLRGLAVERNIAVVTFSQSNKLGASSKIIGMKHAAEDWSKNATADTIISYNQTEVEYPLGLARLHVAKARDDARGFSVLISQQYAAAQFCLESTRMVDSTYWSLVGKGEDEEAEDEEKPARRNGRSRR